MSRTVTAVLLLAALAAAVPSSAAAQAAPAAPAGRSQPRPWADDAAASQLFHVTLVAATRQNGGSGQSDLPKAVAKALDDIKDFLPYQGYRVVDSSLVRATREFHARLSGPDRTVYQADALFSGAGGGESAVYLVEHFELRKLPRVEDLAREMERGGSNRAAIAPMAPEPNLTATFRIARGETVVVGSSRLDGGDDALIVLLTAVP